MVRIGITGAAGRMGRTLVEAVNADVDAKVATALERPDSPAIGSDAGELSGIGRNGIVIEHDLARVINQFDVLIDFSSPRPTERNTQLCAEHGIPIVIGTTGLNETQLANVQGAAADVAVCMASNFSVGVTLCLKLAETAASALGEEFDVEIIEAHHRHKVDAPSGTALSLGKAVAEAFDRNLADVSVYGRVGQVGARTRSEIGFCSIRGGDLVGEHTVLFAGDGERVEISHRASSRMAFARGAVRAARWLLAQPPGFYDMRDVLGIR